MTPTNPPAEYDVIANDDLAGLIAEVDDAITDGWRPLGGLAVEADTYSYNNSKSEGTATALRYLQAMTKGIP